jgi:hypothetical protein
MFKRELKDKLIKIFGIPKTTYDDPSDSYEQDTLFVSVSDANPRISSDTVSFEVKGTLTIYCQREKLQYGFFSRAIERASLFTGRFFFSNIDTDIENSGARMNNIHELRCNFIYLYSGKFDPARGEITSVEFN